MGSNGNGNGNGNGTTNGTATGTANGSANGNADGENQANGVEDANGNGHANGLRTAEVKYYVLGVPANPYLLARISWPDIAQAISAGRRNWLDDLGLFDLPYDPISTEVTFDDAAAIASKWGTSLPSEQTAIDCPLPLIRRMPADWSGLTPAEKRAWALEFIPTGLRADASHQRAEVKALQSERRRARLRTIRRALGGYKDPADVVVTNGHSPVPVAASATSPAEPAESPDRRRHARVPTGGRAQIRCGNRTVSATLVDVSQGGVRWHLLDTQEAPKVGEELHPSLVLEGSGPEDQVNLDVGATVMWGSDMEPGAQFGVAFQQLTEEQSEQIQHLLLSSLSDRGL